MNDRIEQMINQYAKQLLEIAGRENYNKVFADALNTFRALAPAGSPEDVEKIAWRALEDAQRRAVDMMKAAASG